MQTVFILSTFLISLLRAAKNHLLIPGPPAFFVLYTYLQLSGGLSASRRLTYNIGSCAIRGVSNLREIQLEMVSTILNLAVRKRNLRPSITIKNPRTAHSRERYTPFFVRPALLTILILIGFTTSGQECGDVQKVRLSMNISSEILDSLYVKALNNRIDLLLQSGWQYVEMNEFGSRAKNLNVSERYKFLTVAELIKLSLKKKKAVDALRVVHTIISTDTIDFNFGNIRITGERKLHFYKGLRFRKANISVNCSQDNVYDPDIRFVFDSSNREWKISTNRFIKKQKE